MGQVIRLNPLLYLNSLTDEQYAHIDDVPREMLVKMVGVGFFVALQLGEVSPADLERAVEEFDFLTLADEEEEKCADQAP